MEDHLLEREGPMRVLIVGAGAIGVIYGYHLVQGGAHVTYLVREKYAAKAKEGPLWIRELWTTCGIRGSADIAFSTYEVVSSMEEVREASEAQQFDSVFLAVSSPVVRNLEWSTSLREAVGPATSVFVTTNGMHDVGVLQKAGFARDRILHCSLPIISWQAPLEGETSVAGNGESLLPPIHYYKGPPVGVAGANKPVVEAFAKALTDGALPAVVKEGDDGSMAAVGCVLMSLLVLLEAEGWEFRRFGSSEHLGLLVRAINQALDVLVQTRYTDPPPPNVGWLRYFVSPTTFWLLVQVAPMYFPFPIETYLKYHFTKVGQQTFAFVNDHIDAGHKHDIPVDALQALTALNPRWTEQEDQGEGAAGGGGGGGGEGK